MSRSTQLFDAPEAPMKPVLVTVLLAVACGGAPKTEPAAPAAPAPAQTPLVAPVAANADSAPGASLQGFRLELPCKGEKFEKGEECHWDQALAQTADPAWKLKLERKKQFGGQPGKLYDVTLRVRGVVEPKNFTQGAVKQQHFQIGGTPGKDHYNFYNIQVSDPPSTYTVNRHVDKVGHFVFALDYQVTIPIRAGASVLLGAYDSNDIAIANHKGITVPEIAPTPFDGQFFQIDVVSAVEQPALPQRWSEQQAKQWYEVRGWLVGANYIPSSAVNQLEMWQADTFDPATIERELSWAESLGFTSLRVFLHDLAWQQDQAGFLNRVDQFLGIAQKHKLGVMLVLFDGVWNPVPKAGKQPAPRPHLHNSAWVQSPGAEILRNPARHDELASYVKAVVGRFKDDRRIDMWDVFNEPDNDNAISYPELEIKDKPALSALLVEKTFGWAREAGASQPLTAAPWLNDFSNPATLLVSDRAMLDGSDIISFHNYAKPEDMRVRVENLRRYNRPVICTEYMARPVGSTFDPILGYLKSQQVGAYNWGFVNGKSQTIYPWDSWKQKYTAAPKVWFHDIFDAKGKPFDAKEVAYIRGLTGKK
jgi:hypothetical protein